MALDISAGAILEKNKLSADGVWLVLLEISIPGLQDPLCIVRNTEDIIWNGKTWQAFNFDMDEVSEDSKGELPTIEVRVSNIAMTIDQYIDEASGGVGVTVVLRVVHSKHLDVNIPEIEETFAVQHVTSDNEWVRFSLGGDTPNVIRFPFRRIMKDACPFPFKGIECGYSGGVTTCNHTLAQCRDRGNSVRFGGDPSIPQGGIYARNI